MLITIFPHPQSSANPRFLPAGRYAPAEHGPQRGGRGDDAGLIQFIQANKPYFDVAHALSSVMNLIAWCLAMILLVAALGRGRIESITLRPIGVRMQEAVQATASAARAWKYVVKYLGEKPS